MKNLRLFAIACCALVINSSHLKGQDKIDYPVPEFSVKPYYYYESKNLIVDLDKTRPISDQRTTGYGKSEEFYYFTGEKSSFRIKKGQKVYFIFRWQYDNSNPSEHFNLSKLNINSKKSRRELVTVQKSSWGGGSHNKEEVNIFFTTKKVKTVIDPKNPKSEKDVIRMITIENLEPGEYVWKYGMNQKDYLSFGIDEQVDESVYLKSSAVISATKDEVKIDYPEPSQNFTVYHYNETANEAEELQTASFDMSRRSTGYKTEEQLISTPGSKAPARYKNKQQIIFIVKNGGDQDPLKTYSLFKLETNEKKNRRESVQGKSNHWVGKYEDKAGSAIPFTSKKVKDLKNNSYAVRILIVENLAPGEYVWSKGALNYGGSSGYCFGIDE
jgi:hypothetical protein